MNRYESIMLDHMVENMERARYFHAQNDDETAEAFKYNALLLLECVCDFRKPPKEIPVEDGEGKIVSVVKAP